ncbi:unnamed protein product, partial [Symbiodinium sp. KB8]
AAAAVSSFWEDPAPPKKDFPRTKEGFEQLLSFVADGLTVHLPHLNSEADALAEGIEHLGFALSYSEEKGTGFFRVFQERKAMTLLVQEGLLAERTLRRVRAALFRTVPLGLVNRSMILVNVKEGSFPHLLDQLNQLAKGQPEIPDQSHDVLGNYIAALKRMALRLTEQNADQFLDATAGPEVAKLPLMEEAARYVFHGYDMAETGLLQAKNPRVHGAAVEAAAWRSSNLSCWSGHAAGLEQHIAADAGRKAAVRLGGLARVTVEVFWDEGVCGQHVDRTEAQTAAAMRQREDRGAVRAAMAKEQDVLDFLVDLLSLGQPAVTQAVAAVIVCGPLLSQLHVLAAPVWKRVAMMWRVPKARANAG